MKIDKKKQKKGPILSKAKIEKLIKQNMMIIQGMKARVYEDGSNNMSGVSVEKRERAIEIALGGGLIKRTIIRFLKWCLNKVSK